MRRRPRIHKFGFKVYEDVGNAFGTHAVTVPDFAVCRGPRYLSCRARVMTNSRDEYVSPPIFISS
jgi:hypothetical protein